MEDLTEYYSDTSREVLELIDYHKQSLLDAEKSGNLDPEQKEKLQALDSIKHMVLEHVLKRKENKEKEAEVERELLIDRCKVLCPMCEVERAVKIIGEKKAKKPPVTLDVVKCVDCGHEFINETPNNWHDRIVFLDVIIGAFEFAIKNQGDRKYSNAEIDEHLESIEQLRNMKKAQLELERTELDLKRALDDAEKAHEDIRDYLLMAKLKGMRWDDLSKFVN